MLYNYHLEEINTDLIDILRSSKDDVKSKILDDEKENLIEDEEQDEYRPDWMFLAEMRLKAKFVDIDTFVNRNCRINAEKENIIVDYQMLNGTAETGKTYLIKAIRGRLQEMVGTRSKSPIIVLAPTEVAAFNINRVTIHSRLSIPIINDSKCLNINSE
ncbi:ATP-dependent DNA helicase Pif1-like [Rhizophagus clarus]|uniref:ATP-dependent DNA helicase n=1 Tax=Rhizophagus clarus TaxID=94130 RepID=A0A8H3M2G8_9GLOM|nr:ATP-dependent DNA helicase Pif1-like [Rhizophagus clarus]